MNRQERFKNTPKFNSNEKRHKALDFSLWVVLGLGFFFNLAKAD